MDPVTRRSSQSDHTVIKPVDKVDHPAGVGASPQPGGKVPGAFLNPAYILLFIRGEWFVTIAALTGLIWVICDAAGLGTRWSAGISDGRPLLGRKIAGKSQRELQDLGLAVENPASGRQ
jgi:hypothetical protein